MTVLRAVLAALMAGSLIGCSTTVEYRSTSVPKGVLDVCLSLPEAESPRTNGELAEGFLTAREGHETCRGVVQTVHDYFGAEKPTTGADAPTGD